MKPIIKFLPIILAATLVVSCAQEEGVEALKTKLAELKNQVGALNTEIKTLETEISKLDPEFANANKKSILITTAPARKGEFELPRQRRHHSHPDPDGDVPAVRRKICRAHRCPDR